jgi:short subunit dehydrogenase-like uncharacterized protein
MNSQSLRKSAQDVPILVGNLDDPESLRGVLSQTRVVIATAGPFSKLGTPVVEAAVETGTHYVDITGGHGDP